MVATKQGNNMKRRMPTRQNNGRFKTSPRMNGLKPFNNRINMNPMFNTSQIPDNPGYVDFNEPTPPPIQPVVPIKMNHKPMSSKGRYPRRMNQSNVKSQRNQSNSNGWGPNHGLPMGNPHHMVMPSHPSHGRNFRGRPLPPPMGMRPPMPPPLPLPNMNARFGPRPLIPMGLPPINPAMGPLRPPLRIGGPIPPRSMLTRSGGSVNTMNGGPIRRNKGNQNNRKNINKNRKRGGNVGSNIKGKKPPTTKKTLNEIVNQYPLDKPWVTGDIRDEQKKKEDIENRLKGNKNDKLFADFKVQRDKFVKMYEAARLEYIGKHLEKDIDKILTESDKGGLIAKVKTVKSAAT